jgi:Kef-type K+ transport system membrane component KefB/predicted transcriptional regulator
MYQMIDSVLIASAEGSGQFHWNVVLLFGLIVLGGAFGARLFQRLHIPQVVGCIVMGIILGEVLGIITPDTIDQLEPFTMFALGIIGFMIGAELRGEVFRKYGKQFFIILFSQGMGAFFLVTIGGSAAAWFITESIPESIAVGLVLGAIASATAPAATVNVLWEYKTRGPLTTAVLAIVALDDALALLLYRGAATGAKALTGVSQGSILGTTLILLGEIAGSVVLGILAGVLLFFLLKFVKSDDKILDFALASLLLVVGLSMIPGIDPILPAMTLGITVANLMPRRSKATFALVEKFAPPIYISFFVIAGAHMEFGRITSWMLLMIFVYVLCRAIGKMTGAWFGGKWSKAPAVVRKYLGLCLLPQAGVAIGLAILASQQFGSELGHTIVIVVMTGTFLMEIFGPMLVKVGVKRAGEVGLNITEEDLIRNYRVADVMDDKPISIAQNLPLHKILEVFSTSDSVYYPVVDDQLHISGIITIAGIKEMFANQDVAGWLLACDVAEPVQDIARPDQPLEEVMEWMERYQLEHLPIVAGDDGNQLIGILDHRKVLRKVSAEVLHRRQTADGLAIMPG